MPVKASVTEIEKAMAIAVDRPRYQKKAAAKIKTAATRKAVLRASLAVTFLRSLLFIINQAEIPIANLHSAGPDFDPDPVYPK